MNRKKKIVLMLTIWSVLLLVGFNEVVSAERTKSNKSLQELEQASEALYQDMQNGNVNGAYDQMENLTKIVQNLSFVGLTSVEGIHALTECILDVRQALVKAEPSVETWAVTSARLRLAVNSLIHQEDALWLQYYKIMAEDLQTLAKVRISGSLAAVRGAFVSFRDHYEMIRPAAMIGQGPSSIALMDSWVSYLERSSADSSTDGSSWDQTLSHGETLLNQLFGHKKNEPVLLPLGDFKTPWSWTMLIGGWIVVALSYTAFRKYWGTQQVQSINGKK